MSRKISRYPGTLPEATMINYDFPALGKPTEFIVGGNNFSEGMKIYFWNGEKLISNVEANKPEDYGNGKFSIECQVTFAESGMYQLVLENDNVPKRAQPFWIFVE